jgi:hypothetical protein
MKPEPEDFRARAQECEEHAKRARDEALRGELARMAQTFHDVADELERRRRR